jgi:hypothetical protein
MSQYHNQRRIVLLFLASVVALGNALSQTDAPDPRVLSVHYWQSFIDRGIVQGNPDVPVEPAIYTRTQDGVSLVPNDPDVCVTGAATNTTQSETSIFVDPLNNMRALNSNNSTNYPFSTLYGTSRFLTTDNGASWTGSVTSPDGNNIGDPAAGIGRNGNLYIGHITNAFGQAVSRSTDGGASWDAVTVLGSGTLDKNHLWVDNAPGSPSEGNVYSSWTNFSNPYGEIEVMRSTNDGVSYGDRESVSDEVNAGSHNQGVNLQTGPNGELYVCWAIYDVWAPPYSENALGFSMSADGGLSFTPATRIQTILGIRGQGTNLGGSYPIRLASFPVMAVDRSDGPRSGWIYIVWTERVSGANGAWNTYIISSADGGDSWTPRVLVGEEASATGKKEFYPWITCDDETGNLSVLRYDNRNSGTNAVEVWVSESTDGGATWEDSQISDIMFTPAPIPGLAGGYMGDYIGISALGGRVHPVWTDNRFGTPTRALAWTQSHDFGGGGGGGIPCEDIMTFQARCNPAGNIQARLTMTDNSHAGEMVVFSIDGDPYPATISGAGGTIASINVPGLGAGPHTVDLSDPAGCTSPVEVRCRVSSDQVDLGWDGEEYLAAQPEVRGETRLLGNHPNPFNPSTSISYSLADDGFVSLKIYNTLGQEVATLVNEYQVAGTRTSVWNGRNEYGATVASGIYIYRLTTGNIVLSEKMLFMK